MKTQKTNRCGGGKHWVADRKVKNGGFCRKNPKGHHLGQESIVPSTTANPQSLEALRAIGIGAGVLAVAGVGVGTALLLTKHGREEALASVRQQAAYQTESKNAVAKEDYDRRLNDLEATFKAQGATSTPTTNSPVSVAVTAPPVTVNVTNAPPIVNVSAPAPPQVETPAPVPSTQTAEYGALGERLGQRERDLAVAQAQVEAHRSSLDELKQKMRQSKSDRKRLKADLDSKNAALAESTAALKESDQKVTDLNKEIAIHRNKGGKSKETIATLTKGLAEVQEERGLLATRITAYSKELVSTKKELEAATLEGINAANNARELAAKKQELDAIVSSHEKELKELRSTLSELNTEHENLSKAHGELQSNMEQQVEQKTIAKQQELEAEYHKKVEELKQNLKNRIATNAIESDTKAAESIAAARNAAQTQILDAQKYSAFAYGKPTGTIVDHLESGAQKTHGGIQLAASIKQKGYPIDTVLESKFVEDIVRRNSALMDDLHSNVVVHGTGSGRSLQADFTEQIKSLSKKGGSDYWEQVYIAFSQHEKREGFVRAKLAEVKSETKSASERAASSFHSEYSTAVSLSEKAKILDRYDKQFRKIYKDARTSLYDYHAGILSSKDLSLRGALDAEGTPIGWARKGILGRFNRDPYIHSYLRGLA